MTNIALLLLFVGAVLFILGYFIASDILFALAVACAVLAILAFIAVILVRRRRS